MMVNTYTMVSENSIIEWRFYRLELVSENVRTNLNVPFNFVIVPVVWLLRLVWGMRNLKYVPLYARDVLEPV